MLLEKVQTHLESLYGIGLGHRVEDYLIGHEEVTKYVKAQNKLPKELFLVRKAKEDTVEIALFLDRKLLTNLNCNDPFISLNDNNLSDFCIAIEGVSHFVYYLWKAQQNMNLTQLEMELQAEIDKFLMLSFFLQVDGKFVFSNQLLEVLFDNFELIESMTPEAQGRYITASNLASRFCYNLKNKFRDATQITELVNEIRLFYSLTQEQKISYILH